jgi:hypothetical protein
LISVGPLKVEVRLPQDVRASNVRMLVSGRPGPFTVKQGWARVEIPSVLDHEVFTIE